MMATPTSRRAAPTDKLLEEHDTLCTELIALEREGGERGESFKVTLGWRSIRRTRSGTKRTGRGSSKSKRSGAGASNGAGVLRIFTDVL
jgi:hypothetical protein